MTVLIFTLIASLILTQATQLRAPISDTTNSTDLSSTEILSVISIKSNFSTISPDGKILLLYNFATNSIGVYDVSNLESPTQSSSINLESPSAGMVSAIISPDSKTGYIVHEYLNEEDGHQGELSIFDLSDIRSPVRLSTYIVSGSGAVALSRDAKTLFIWDRCPKQRLITPPTVIIIDVSNATFPNLLSYHGDERDKACTSADSVLYLSGDSLIYYENYSLKILDVSNLTSPVLLNSSDVLFTPVSMVLSSDGKTAFVIDQDIDVDQSPISLKALNLTNPNSIQKIGALVLGPLDNDVSGLGVMAISPDNNYIFVAGYNKLLVVDISDLQNMTSKTVDMISEPIFVALSPDGRSLFVTNGIQVTILELYIDSQTSQKFTLPSITNIQEFTLPQNSSWGVLDDMIISSDQNTAFVTYNGSCLAIFDMSNKATQTLLSVFDTTQQETIDSITISSDEKAAFLAFMDKILVLDISNLTSPTLINTLPANSLGGSQLFAISYNGQIAFAMTLTGFQVVNISDMAAPINISSYISSVENYNLPVAFTLSQDEKTVFLLVWEDVTTYVLETIDISNLSNPKLVTSFSIQDGNDNESSVESDVFHVSISSDNKAAFFGLNNICNNLEVFDLSNPALPIQVDWSDLNINASQRALISSDSSTAFIATLSELLVIDITSLATPQILRSYPIIETVSMFLSNDESTMYLAALNGTWIEVNLQPQYTFEMWNNDFVLGEVYSNTLEAFQINKNNYLGPMSQNYSFTTVSLYSVTSVPGTKNTETQTTFPLLPNWIEFDQSHGIVTFKPNTQDQIGQYQLYSALSFSIPDGIFVNTSIANITDQTESLDLIVSLITLGYMNNQGFLTSSFNSSNKLYLPSQYSPYESDIRSLLSPYYIEMTASFAVGSSLSLSASRYILINTKSENTISVAISISQENGTQAQFVKANYPILTTYSSDQSTITMEGTLNSINKALTEIIINTNDDDASNNGSITVSDGLNPVIIKQLTNISSYFVLNQPPVIGDSIQSQINETQIYTGEQFIISINGSFVDDNGQDLEYSLAMQDSTQQVPNWLTLRDSSLVGTPPEQITDSEIDVVITAKNQFKSSQQTATIKIKISLTYALKLIGTYGGALITVLGLWIYMSTIYNIFCKKRYRYPKDIYVKIGDEQSVRNVCSISFIAKEIKAAKIVLNEIRKIVARESKINKPQDSDVAAFFVDSKSGKFDEDKFFDTTKDAMLKLGVVGMDQSNESSFIKGYLRKEVIQQVVLDKILHYQLSLKKEKDTKNIFEKVKKYWISFIETTTDPLQYRVNRTELRKTLKEKGILKSYLSAPDNELISSDKGHINNAEDTIEVHNEHQISRFDEEPALSEKPDQQNQTPLLQKQPPKSKRPQINVDLLERLLISTAFKYHNLDVNAYDIKVIINQKPFGNTLWLKVKKFVKRDLAEIEFAGKGEAMYGIKYEVNEGVLRFYGEPREGLKGETLIVQVTNKRGWILRELWLNCVMGSVKIGNKSL